MKSYKMQSPRRRLMKAKNRRVNKGSMPHPAMAMAKARSFASKMKRG